jgi:hypothetical protein
LITLGLAVVSLGVGVTFHVIRESNAESFNDTVGCNAARADKGSGVCLEKYNAVDSAEPFMTIGYVGAGVFGITSAALFLTSPSTPAAPSRVSLRCAPSAAVPGIACVGAF